MTHPHEVIAASRTGGRITRLLLWLLALLELTVGAVGLIGAVQIFRAPDAGMALIFAPVLAILALLLVAGAAIFVRRPWSRNLHIGVLALVGLLLVVYIGPLLGPLGWLQVLAAVLIVVGPLTWIFRLAPVRRYFDRKGMHPSEHQGRLSPNFGPNSWCHNCAVEQCSREQCQPCHRTRPRGCRDGNGPGGTGNSSRRPAP